MFDLWEQLVSDLDAPELPIELAQRSRLEDLELLGFTVITAPTFLCALESFVRFCALLNDGMRWELCVDRRRIVLRTRQAEPLRLGVRLSIETAIGQSVSAARQLCGGGHDPLEVSFRHAAPPSLRAHRALFRSALTFDAPFDQVVFPRALGEAVPTGANRPLWSYLTKQASESLGQLAPRSLATRVRDALARCIELGEPPAMAAVARGLGMSERTLRRALTSEGTGFGALLDEVRRERALHLLARGDQAITRTALEVGFSDAATFSHACRRWFGSTPRALARRLQTAEAPHTRCPADCRERSQG